jgi:hypothetical protein
MKNVKSSYDAITDEKFEGNIRIATTEMKPVTERLMKHK